MWKLFHKPPFHWYKKSHNKLGYLMCWDFIFFFFSLIDTLEIKRTKVGLGWTTSWWKAEEISTLHRCDVICCNYWQIEGGGMECPWFSDGISCQGVCNHAQIKGRMEISSSFVCREDLPLSRGILGHIPQGCPCLQQNTCQTSKYYFSKQGVAIGSGLFCVC